jgi:hypothetical protein
MTSSIRTLLLGLVAFAAASAVEAQDASSKPTPRAVAVEIPAGSMVLPQSATSSAVFPACGGCLPKSFPVTAATQYYLSKSPVTVADLKAAIIGHPDLALTVKYYVDSGQIVSISASAPAPRVNAPIAR